MASSRKAGKPKLQLTQDSEARRDLKLEPGSQRVPVAAIQLRQHGNARQLMAEHVVTLAESIAALSLLEPPILNQHGQLLAGAHRLAALQLLLIPDADERRRTFLARLGKNGKPQPPRNAETDDAEPALLASVQSLADRIASIDTSTVGDAYGDQGVPVLVVVVPEDAGTVAGPAADLAIEAAENSVRRQYSKNEVQALARKLEKKGYTMRTGRPRKSEKSVRVVLEALLGRSTRQVQRLLDDKAGKKKDGWALALAAFKRAAKKMREHCPDGPAAEKRLAIALDAVAKAAGAE